MELDTFEAIKRRRSIRRYAGDEVEEEKLKRVLEAARLSPSACNYQPWHFIVVKDPEIREEMRRAYDEEWFVSAPVQIVVCADPSLAWKRPWDEEEYWMVDGAIAMQSLVLQAAAEGLGTCWIAAFHEEEAKKVLGIPDHVRVVAMTPLGYPAEAPPPTTRKPLVEVTRYNRW